MSRVVVVGGGVSGLTTALCLLSQFKETIAELTVLAAELPGDYHALDYTSPWAGANWCSFAQEGDDAQIRRDRFTYGMFMKLADTEPAAGIKKYPLKIFFGKDDTVPWYIRENAVEGIKKISAEETRMRKLDPAEAQGYEYTTVTVSPTRFNTYLISQISKAGGTVRRVKRMSSITEVVDVVGYVPTLVVNCTGVNAGKLLRDVDPEEMTKVYPIRGQIMQIYEDLPFQVIVDCLPVEDGPRPDQFLNIFPRPEGGCIVGGIASKRDGSREVDADLSASILRVVKRHVPELTSTTVYNSYVAHRPGRDGGVRIGLSEYPLGKHSGSLRVVHNYGIGGAGYQSSYGSAMEVCGYASKVLGKRSKTCSCKL